MSKLTSSITSTKASFLRYLMSARRHESAPVACMVILEESSCCVVSTPPRGADQGTYHCPLRLDALGGDVHLQSICLGVLGVSKVEDLVQQLVYQDKVVLDSLLVKLAKVCLSQAYQTVQKLKDECGIGIALGDGDQVDILVLDMAEGGGAQGEDGRADLGIGNDLDAEDVGKSRAAVVAECAKYEVLTLLVEDEDSGEHSGGVKERARRRQGIGGVGVLMLELHSRCRGIELGPCSLR